MSYNIPTHRPYVGNMDTLCDNIDMEMLNLMDKVRTSFIQVVQLKDQEYLGWKYTIVADNFEDYKWLYIQIGSYLRRINQPFKVATKALLSRGDAEQRNKCITIYITKSTKVDYLLDDLKHFLKGYNPRIRLKYSEHVDGPIWKRHDTDENGNYIPADPKKR